MNNWDLLLFLMINPKIVKKGSKSIGILSLNLAKRLKKKYFSQQKMKEKVLNQINKIRIKPKFRKMKKKLLISPIKITLPKIFLEYHNLNNMKKWFCYPLIQIYLDTNWFIWLLRAMMIWDNKALQCNCSNNFKKYLFYKNYQ